MRTKDVPTSASRPLEDFVILPLEDVCMNQG